MAIETRELPIFKTLDKPVEAVPVTQLRRPTIGR
jgi:hypothetical protein